MVTWKKLAAWLPLVCTGWVAAATVQVQVADASGKPLGDAVVFLESREGRLASKPLVGVEIVQSKRQFDPRVLVVPVGTAVAFPNRDSVRHHVYSFSPTKTFELKLYSGVDANPVLFDRAGIAVLGCNIHDNMTAWVVVVETPYFGRSTSLGVVNMASVPPGNYRLRVWHPALPVGAPATDQALTVTAVDSVTVVRLAGATP